jgi:hypothetical protein
LNNKVIHPLKNNFVFFIFSPFIGLIQAFKHYNEKWAKNSLWLFVIFYGYTMFRPDTMDSSRYVLKLQELYNTPLSWSAFSNSFYSDQGDTIDIYQPLVTYLLSLFTDNGNILFAVFGIVFGYYYSRNVWLLIDQIKDKKMNKTLWLLVIAFACVIGFWNLNGVRMWTAAHMFFYGAFQLIVNRKKKGLFIAIASMLVHFSFIIPIAILLFYITIKIPWRILYFFFIASFFISALNMDVIRARIESVAPSFLLPKVSSYTSDEYVEVVTDDLAMANWYIAYYSKFLSWFLVILITSIYFSKTKWDKYPKSFSSLFGFTLLFLTIGNITSLLPSGNRYLLVAQLFGITLLFMYYINYENKKFNMRLLLLTPLLVMYVLVSIRMSFDTITFLTILSNPIIATFVDLPIPLISLFK